MELLLFFVHWMAFVAIFLAIFSIYVIFSERKKKQRRIHAQRETDRIVRQISRLLDQWENEREDELSQLMQHHFINRLRLANRNLRKDPEKVNWKKEGF